jgi:S-adenosylmethionine decarboxylase
MEFSPHFIVWGRSRAKSRTGERPNLEVLDQYQDQVFRDRQTAKMLKGNGLQALGKHLLVELHGCDPEALKSIDLIREAMVSAAKVANATIVGVSFHEFSPFGVSEWWLSQNPTSRFTPGRNIDTLQSTYSLGDLLRPEVAVTILP